MEKYAHDHDENLMDFTKSGDENPPRDRDEKLMDFQTVGDEKLMDFFAGLFCTVFPTFFFHQFFIVFSPHFRIFFIAFSSFFHRGFHRSFKCFSSLFYRGSAGQFPSQLSVATAA